MGTCNSSRRLGQVYEEIRICEIAKELVVFLKEDDVELFGPGIKAFG